jgi:uncharacterized protein
VVFHIFAVPAFLSAVGVARVVRPEAAPPRASLVAASVDELALEPAPVEPSWVISGNPQARMAEHSQSADDAGLTALWDCTAGAFRWHFRWDETVMIIEGSVVVTDEAGNVRTLKAGDVAYFAGGTWATWEIEHYVRKIAFLRRPLPAGLVFAARVKRSLARIKNGSRNAGPLR